MEERILTGRFKLDDTVDKFNQESIIAKQDGGQKKTPQLHNSIVTNTDKRQGIVTAKLDNPRATLLSQATTAGHTTMAPGTAGVPNSIKDALE